MVGEVTAFARWKGLASDAGAEGRVGVELSETARGLRPRRRGAQAL